MKEALKVGNLIEAIRSVWDVIGHDVDVGSDNEAAIEICFDCDRLESYPAAKEEWEALKTRFGRSIALTIISDLVPLV